MISLLSSNGSDKNVGAVWGDEVVSRTIGSGCVLLSVVPEFSMAPNLSMKNRRSLRENRKMGISGMAEWRQDVFESVAKCD